MKLAQKYCGLHMLASEASNVVKHISRNLALVRADVSRLPFASGSVDAIHAGAALHCWPSPSNAVIINSNLSNFDEIK